MNQLQQTFDCPAPVVLVTGSGAPRVGRVIAQHFAALRCDIALHANCSTDQANQAAKQLTSDHGIKTLVTVGQLQDAAQCQRIVDETFAHFGRLDVLVNSAAIWSPTPLEDISVECVRSYFEINAMGSFFCARAAGLKMVSQDRGGAIINLGDWATVRPYLDHAAYFPSKGAVETMTRSLAVELGHRNPSVRVNCVQPGPVLLDHAVNEQTRSELIASTLTGRIGTPHDIAHAVQMLSENTFITGVCLPVDGGRSVFANDALQTGYNTG